MEDPTLGLSEESPELDPIDPSEPEEFVVTKPMKFVLGPYTMVITPDETAATEEEMPLEEGEGSTLGLEPEDEFSLGGDSRGFFSDSAIVRLDVDSAESTPEGYLKLPGVTIAKAMVQTYQDSKGRTKRVLKAADALRDMTDYGTGRPVTDEHPAGGVVMSKKDTRGFIDNLYFTDTNEVKADINIICPRLQKIVKDGKKSEVSIGFYSNINATPGVFNDESYDEIQTDIWLDHLAIVKSGRCSRKDGCGITDSVKPKIKIVKVRDKVVTKTAPLKVADSVETIAEKTKLINEIQLVTDSDINAAELIKWNTEQLKVVNDMMQSSKIAFNLDMNKKETIDEVVERLQKKKN